MLLSNAWFKVFLKPSLSSTHAIFSHPSSSIGCDLRLCDACCGQFCGCACLRLSQSSKVGSYPSLTNQPLTDQTAAVLQVTDFSREGGGRRVQAFWKGVVQKYIKSASFPVVCPSLYTYPWAFWEVTCVEVAF